MPRRRDEDTEEGRGEEEVVEVEDLASSIVSMAQASLP